MGESLQERENQSPRVARATCGLRKSPPTPSKGDDRRLRLLFFARRAPWTRARGGGGVRSEDRARVRTQRGLVGKRRRRVALAPAGSHEAEGSGPSTRRRDRVIHPRAQGSMRDGVRECREPMPVDQDGCSDAVTCMILDMGEWIMVIWIFRNVLGRNVSK